MTDAAPDPLPPAVVAPLRDRDDVRRAAALHERALPLGLFSRAGAGFLTTWLTTFTDSPHAVAFVAHVDGRFAGFLVGTHDNEAHYAWALRRRGPRLALRFVAALLRRPALLRTVVATRLRRYAAATLRLLRRRVGRGGAAVGSAEPEPGTGEAATRPERVAVLTHVAVVPEARGAGVGALLDDAFLAAVAAAGAAEARLVTGVASGAAGFYLRRGWTEHDRRSSGAEAVVEFRRSIDPAGPL